MRSVILRCLLERRPRYGGPVLTRLRILAGRDQAVNPAPRRMHLGRAEQRAELLAERTVEVFPQLLQRLQELRLELLPAPTPQQRAQLVLDRKTDAMVTAEDMTFRRRQQVPTLAVRVVDDRVEDRHPAERVDVTAREHAEAERLVDVDPELTHAGAEPPVAQYRRRHDAPPECFGHGVRRDLS